MEDVAEPLPSPHPEDFPTPLARAVARLQSWGLDSSAECFLYAGYAVEVAIRSIVIACRAVLASEAPEAANKIGLDLIRADGLGDWERVLRAMTQPPLSGHLNASAARLLAWATRKRRSTEAEDAQFFSARDAIAGIISLLGQDEAATAASKHRAARDLVADLVFIRNKTKAHGAVGSAFFSQANALYVTAITELFADCPPLRTWHWFYVAGVGRDPLRVSRLIGVTPSPVPQSRPVPSTLPGADIYVVPDGNSRWFACGHLVQVSTDPYRFSLPNGGLTDTGFCEFLDYESGETSRVNASGWKSSPQLPRSETHGLPLLDVQSNAFGNLPPLPVDYVARLDLEREVLDLLTTRQQRIVTLHGYGGVGKTSLALRVAHALSSELQPPFESILWFSARDVDLQIAGPTPVAPAVVNLSDVAAAFGRFFSVQPDVDSLAKGLEDPSYCSMSGILFIFDNFETMDHLRSFQDFLEVHTRFPNRVIITTREAGFRGDYPVEVGGMSVDEAKELVGVTARTLGAEALATEANCQKIIDYTRGHAYLIKVLVGEMAREGKFISPHYIVPKQDAILDAILERSFSRLSDDGRRVFMTLANYRSAVAELALLVVLGADGVNVESGVEECLRLSLVSRDYLADGYPYFSVPPIARLFGQRKVKGDPDRLVVQNDVKEIIHFGILGTTDVGAATQEEVVRRYVQRCRTAPGPGEEGGADLVLSRLRVLATLWPEAWLDVASYIEERSGGADAIDDALRRACEELPYSRPVWERRAAFARRTGEYRTEVLALTTLAEIVGRDAIALSDIARRIVRAITDAKDDIPVARRGLYLATVRELVERVRGELDATGLSRLAWLYLLENDQAHALECARAGIERDPANTYCRELLNRLDSKV